MDGLDLLLNLDGPDAKILKIVGEVGPIDADGVFSQLVLVAVDLEPITVSRKLESMYNRGILEKSFKRYTISKKWFVRIKKFIDSLKTHVNFE